MAEIETTIERIEQGDVQPVYLVAGDRVVSEPAGLRIAESLAEAFGCQPDIVRRPDTLSHVLQDLRTLALFATGKVTLVVESSLLADEGTAPALLDEAIECPSPSSADSALDGRQRRAAACLLQALRLFRLDPYAGSADEAIGLLPKSALEGGAAYRKKSRRRRSASQIATAREGLALLLDAARLAEMQGIGESDEELLVEIAREGLPPGHALVLAESACSDKHPLVAALREKGALLSAGKVEASRRSGWTGLDVVCTALERETGASIERSALQELARRTLRKRPQAGRGEEVDASSTARFAAEYRKLATLASGKKIGLALVREVVQDRGEEDVWGILDAIGEGNTAAAIAGVDRLLKGAEDVIGTRLSVFSLLAGFCRQLTAVSAIVEKAGLPPNERSYSRFKERLAPRIQGKLDGGGDNPLAGVHPYRLHKVYLAAAQLGAERLQRLPARALETERRLKGDSSSPDAALTAFIARLAPRRESTSGRRG